MHTRINQRYTNLTTKAIKLRYTSIAIFIHQANIFKLEIKLKRERDWFREDTLETFYLYLILHNRK